MVSLNAGYIKSTMYFKRKRLAVFCGSSSGSKSIFLEQAYQLGKTLAGKQIELVYGGANVGLMGAVANGVMENGGVAIGVLPNFLQRVEIAHNELSELILVDSMHERKAKMEELSDGFISLPGGFGTLEEFFEILTWLQLGLHKKPIALLNTDGFYDDLLAMVETMFQNGFLKQENKNLILVSDDIEDLLSQMENYKAPTVGKWLDKKSV